MMLQIAANTDLWLKRSFSFALINKKYYSICCDDTEWHLLLYWKREPTEEEREANEPLLYKISEEQKAVFPDLQNFREHPDYEKTWKEKYSLIVRVIFLIVLQQLHELGELIYFLSHSFAVSSPLNF